MNRRNVILKALTVAVVAAISVGGAFSLPIQAATKPAVAATDEQVTKSISLLENRFFSRQYANDPLEKRLERLELLVFGGTQDGSNDQRYNRLKVAIAERAQAGSKTAQSGSKTPDKELGSSAQYPVLNTLEWRALQKTYPSESLDQRLGRLEKKLFGQENTSMAYIDRVDRLKRTLGVGVTAVKPAGPLGPAPKARPHGADPIFGFAAPSISQDFDEMPMFDGTGLAGTFTQMFRDLNRQMAEMNKLGPGEWVYDSDSGVWVEKNSGKKIKPVKPGQPFSLPESSLAPRTQPKVVPMPTQPRMMQPLPFFQNFKQDNNGGLPPYADPNSI